jgi:hypothetical protein
MAKSSQNTAKKKTGGKRSKRAATTPRKREPVMEPQAGRDLDGKFQPGNAIGFQPGQSGNPQGRPRVRTLSEAYRRKLTEVDPRDPQRRTYAETIAEYQCNQAAGGFIGSTQAAKEIADRTEGRPRQQVEFSDQTWWKNREQFERLVERVIQRAQDEKGIALSWDEAVRKVATYKPEVYDYLELGNERVM